MYEDGILEGFTPNFKSIRKDCDRYSNELVKLFEADKIDTRGYLDLNAKGSLWIALEYIENGLRDEVEADLRKTMAGRDSYGALHENTRSTLARLIECSEHDRVFALYRAAIKRRLKALKEEAAIRDRPTSSVHARTASATWVEHYLPAVQDILQDYEAILARAGRVDTELVDYRRSLQKLEST